MSSARITTATLNNSRNCSCLFHSRDQRQYWFTKTKDDFCIKVEFNSRRNGLVHQCGRHFTNTAAMTSYENALFRFIVRFSSF